MSKKSLKITIIIFFSILFVIGFVFFAPKLKEKFSDNLNYNRIVRLHGKCGLQDKSGKILIEPLYDKMQKTSNGLIAVIKDNKLGLFDINGKVIIQPTYDTDFLEYHFGFSEGLAPVIQKTKDGYNNCVYIDKTGKIVLDPTKFGASTVQDESYGACSQFSEGLAPATYTFDGSEGHFASGDYGYINKQGKVIIKVDNVDDQMCGDALCILSFQNGIAQVAINGEWKYIDKTGKFVKPKYEHVGDFSEGLASFYNHIGNQETKYGFVNKKGEVVIKPQFDEVGDFSEGLARVMINYKWGYINKKGQIVIKPQFEEAKDFSEGLAPAGLKYNAYGFIDKTGKFIIEPQYWDAKGFSNGEAFVEEAGDDKREAKVYYINKKGEKLYETCGGLE